MIFTKYGLNFNNVVIHSKTFKQCNMNPSPEVYNPKAFVLFWKPFIRFFQAICVSHYSIFHPNNNIYRFIYFIIFSTLHISLMFYTLTHGLHIQLKPIGQHKESPLMFYVSSVSLAGNFISHTIAHLEPLFTRKDEEEIYHRLNKINGIFALKLNYVTNFDVIKQKFVKKTVVFYISIALISFGYSFFSLPSDNFSVLLFLLNRMFAVVIIRARRCQAAFIINSMNNILKDLQVLLKRQQECYRPHSTNSLSHYYENIRYLRDVYSNIWLIKNLIGRCFGWSMIAFLMEFSLDLINSSYWAYINIKVYESSTKIFRKFFVATHFDSEILLISVIFLCVRNFLLYHFNYHKLLVFMHDLWALSKSCKYL